MTRLIYIYLRDLKAGEHACRFIMLGPVVRKAVNANLGLLDVTKIAVSLVSKEFSNKLQVIV